MGKSTLFQAITKCSLGNPANFPYATIDPEEARVIVPDARYDWLCEHYKPKSQVPANLTVYDIAGLTRGSSTGAGLGNAFLSHIRAVDAIFQVVRCFDDAEITHVEGDVNPVRDLDIIADELRLKDIEFVEKAKENLSKQTRRGGQSLEMKKLKEEEATVDKILQMLKDGKDVRKENWGPKEVSRLALIARTYPVAFYYDEQELYARHNPSSSTAASPNLTLEAVMRGSPTLNYEFFCILYSVAISLLADADSHLTDRSHQPTVPAFRKACCLPHQSLRKGLPSPKEQISSQGNGMDQDQLAKRAYHSHVSVF